MRRWVVPQHCRGSVPVSRDDFVTFEKGRIAHVALVDGEPALVACPGEDICPVCAADRAAPKRIGVVTAVNREAGTVTVSGRGR